MTNTKRAGVVAATLLAIACNKSPVAPDDNILLLIADKRELVAGGDSTTIRAVLQFADGSLAGDRWDVDFVVTGGSIDGQLSAARKRTDTLGTAVLKVRSGPTAGLLIVTARAGESVVVDTLIVKEPEAPAATGST